MKRQLLCADNTIQLFSSIIWRTVTNRSCTRAIRTHKIKQRSICVAGVTVNVFLVLVDTFICTLVLVPSPPSHQVTCQQIISGTRSQAVAINSLSGCGSNMGTGVVFGLVLTQLCICLSFIPHPSSPIPFSVSPIAKVKFMFHRVFINIWMQAGEGRANHGHKSLREL